MTLTEFLLARIAEDEGCARVLPPVVIAEAVRYERIHFARWAPARVLAECEAKRQIVNAVRSGFPDEDRYSTGWHDMHIWALMRLAAPYSDHPDYLRDWKM